MKNILSFTVLGILVLIFMFLGLGDNQIKTTTITQSDDILRIHIRANSNEEKDQQIKYQIKDLVLEYVYRDIKNLNSKQEVIDYFIEKNQDITKLIDTFLKQNQFEYKSKLTINNEYFPTRIYGDNVVESGYYDAIVVTLGESKGENWWCIAYPSICFDDYENFNKDVVYKSRLLEIIKNIIG
ncbi:MAG: stage II sporulation protein R [Clostridia bacterium]|nr:stage II sporulation protein R [Clostridia bacterium]